MAILGWGQGPVSLVRGIAGGNEEHLIEAELITDQARNGQVAVVNGIEAAAEQTQFPR